MTRYKLYAGVFVALVLVTTAIYFIYQNYEPSTDIPMSKDEIIVWSDKAVERQVREKIGKQQGDVWLSDLWDVSRINLEGEEVCGAEDPAVLQKSRTLCLINTSATDLSQIAGAR